ELPGRRRAPDADAAPVLVRPRGHHQHAGALRAVGRRLHHLRRVRAVRDPARGLAAVHRRRADRSRGDRPLDGLRLRRAHGGRGARQRRRLRPGTAGRPAPLPRADRPDGPDLQALLRGEDPHLPRPLWQPRADPGPVRAHRAHLRHPGRRGQPDELPPLHRLHRHRRRALGRRRHRARLLPRKHPVHQEQHRRRADPHRRGLADPDGHRVPAGPPSPPHRRHPHRGV
ncbi:MAG: DedA protein, partial [uncultured Friedmanniella sp.]